LPAIEPEEETTLRSAEDMAKRAVGLCAVALRGQGLKQQEVISLLNGKDVWASVTPEEKKFLLKKNPAIADDQAKQWPSLLEVAAKSLAPDSTNHQ